LGHRNLENHAASGPADCKRIKIVMACDTAGTLAPFAVNPSRLRLAGFGNPSTSNARSTVRAESSTPSSDNCWVISPADKRCSLQLQIFKRILDANSELNGYGFPFDRSHLIFYK
jgi:hypothetical protein